MLKLPYSLQSACSDGQRRTFAHVVCGQCDAYQDHALTGVHNPEMVLKHMRRLGWTVDFGRARHNRCPACSDSRRKRSKVDLMTTKAAAPALAAATMPRDLTPDSDRRVAEESKVPAACVVRLRELAYGPIRSDPELEALRRDLDALAARAKTLSAQLGDVNQGIADLMPRLHAVEARLAGKAA
ncbi:hypothetical protein FHP25_35995 [Vineibacter terrae]|uniref:Uncharacterized protein n=1 Tax=Vineibacter terrae TaxID=2586908 RepID=A0A5C8P8P3_9HYPH|nr:hypothetical protein [Vineibacter terrae]TXL70127.1 hypothetical protein FHP25_35995 [Vineibacter terrae]